MRATIVTSFCVGFLVAAPLWAADPDDAFEFKTLKARAAKSKFDLRRQLATRQYDQSRQTNVAKRDRALAEARAVLLVELREAREAAFKARNSQEIARLEKAMELVKKSGVPIASPPKAVKPPTGSVAVPRDAVKWKGHYYKVFDQTVTWYIAHRECERAGGHLVRIESAEEQAFISSMTAPPAARSQAYWIDGSDEVSQGQWRFSDGRPIKYTNWFDRQPDGGKTQNHLVIITKQDRRWSDASGDVVGYGFICEWDPANPPATTQQPAQSPADRLRQALAGTRWTWESTEIRLNTDGTASIKREPQLQVAWFPLDGNQAMVRWSGKSWDLLTFDNERNTFQAQMLGTPRRLKWDGNGRKVR